MLHKIAKSLFKYTSNIGVKVNPQKWRPLQKKSLHVCASLNAKQFVDRENMHAHQVLASSLRPYQIVAPYNATISAASSNEVILSPNVENIAAGQLFENFKALCCYCQQTNSLLSQEKFSKFISLYCDKLHLLTDEQLLDSLRLLAMPPKEPSVRSPNFKELWNALDIECCRRAEKWKTDELLLICDAWFQLSLARICNFVWMALTKLSRKLIKLQPNQLVQTMFLCNIRRRSVFNMFDFEVNLAKCAKEMTLSELGVMSMGFFKTQTAIRNQELIKYLYQRLMDELMTVDDITFVAILKTLRYSYKIEQAELVKQLLDKIYQEKIDSMNLLTCLHVALHGCDMQYCHDELIEKILHKFNSHIDTVRLKDLERISLVIALYNVHTPSGVEESVCEKILQSLKGRIDEIMLHPKCFTNCLHTLSLRGYYDKEMLSVALEKKFLKHAAGDSLIKSREIFHLDTFIKLNLLKEGYDGPQLQDRTRKKMSALLCQYIPERNTKYKLSATDTILLEVKETADIILPNIQLKHILPNYDRSDIVICYDRLKKKTLAISKDCPEHYSGVMLTRDLLLGVGNDDNKNNIDTIVIVIAGWNNVINGKSRYTALFDMKLKQLALLAHKPVVVNWYEWREQKNHKDRLDFIKRTLSNVTQL